MLLTIARPRPTPAWSLRMRSVPRWNGSTRVETSSGLSVLACVLDSQHHGVGLSARPEPHGALVRQIVDDRIVEEVRRHLQQERM